MSWATLIWISREKYIWKWINILRSSLLPQYGVDYGDDYGGGDYGGCVGVEDDSVDYVVLVVVTAAGTV